MATWIVQFKISFDEILTHTVEKCMSFMRINAQSGGEKIKIKSTNKEIRTNFDINGLLGQITTLKQL